MKCGTGLCVVLGLSMSVAAIAQVTDNLDEAKNFFVKSDAASVTAVEGKVTITKTNPAGDAFARWGNPMHESVAILETTKRLEIVFAEISPGTKVQVQIQLEKAGQDLGHIDLGMADANEKVLVIKDLKSVAEKSGHKDAERFRLLFRHIGDPAGKIVIDKIAAGPVTLEQK